MKLPIQIMLSTGVLSAIMVLSGCKGKDGDPGPAGKDGTNGVDGTNGTNGTNGVGFEAATKNGNIILYLDGTTPAGDPFKDTLDFKFAPGDLSKSSATIYSAASPSDVYFSIERFLVFDNYTVDDYIDFNLEMYANPDTTYTVDFGNSIKANIGTSDFRYFVLTMDPYNADGQNFINDTWTAFQYNPSTGRFSMRFSYTMPAQYNSSGNDLNVAGIVNLLVYQAE